MPAELRINAPFAFTLDLPPPYRLLTLREAGDAFAHAKAHATELGAGALVHVGRFDVVEFAVVLEPEEPLASARRAFYAGMAALAEALIAHAPPEKLLTIKWPDAIYVDHGLVGGGRLAWPARAPKNAPPSWLVFGATIRTVAMTEVEPGLRPHSASLEEEGFAPGFGRLVESFARHLMRQVDAWREQGFATVAKHYLAWLAPEEPDARCELDENGDLLVHRTGKREVKRRALIPALAHPSWLDPATGGPR